MISRGNPTCSKKPVEAGFEGGGNFRRTAPGTSAAGCGLTGIILPAFKPERAGRHGGDSQ